MKYYFSFLFLVTPVGILGLILFLGILTTRRYILQVQCEHPKSPSEKSSDLEVSTSVENTSSNVSIV